MDESSRTDVFPCLNFGLMIIGLEHNLLSEFLKMKLPTTQRIESQDAFMFITEYYERMQKIGIIQQHIVKFLTFLLQKKAKQLWRAYIECRSLIITPLTWEKIHDLFLEKYVSWALRYHKTDEFFALKQGDMQLRPMRLSFLFYLIMLLRFQLFKRRGFDTMSRVLIIMLRF